MKTSVCLKHFVNDCTKQAPKFNNTSTVLMNQMRLNIPREEKVQSQLTLITSKILVLTKSLKKSDAS